MPHGLIDTMLAEYMLALQLHWEHKGTVTNGTHQVMVIRADVLKSPEIDRIQPGSLWRAIIGDGRAIVVGTGWVFSCWSRRIHGRRFL